MGFLGNINEMNEYPEEKRVMGQKGMIKFRVLRERERESVCTDHLEAE